jgi:hypothetical protein
MLGPVSMVETLMFVIEVPHNKSRRARVVNNNAFPFAGGNMVAIICRDSLGDQAILH